MISKYTPLIFSILAALSMPAFAALLNTQPKLPSLEQAIDAIDTHTKPGSSKLAIAYHQSVLLAFDPANLQQKTQFATLKQTSLDALKMHQQQQNSASQPPSKLTHQHYQSIQQRSTLSPDLIAISTNNNQPSQPDSYAEEVAQPQSNALSLASSKYNEKWMRIAQTQEDHATRWSKTKRLKNNAQFLSDMSGDRSRAQNNLILKPSLSKRTTNIHANYPQPQHVLISPEQEAQWVMKMMPQLQQRMPNATQRRIMLQQVYRQAKQFGLQADLILALIQIESNFKPNAISTVGAQGLMQVMPFWKKELGGIQDNLHDITTNIRYGCQILKHYLDIENGKMVPALARYNGSYGRNKYPNKVIHAWLDHWQHL